MANNKFKVLPGLIGLLLAGAAQSVLAQAANDWSACHVGGHAGYGWADIEGWSETNPVDHPSIGSATAKGGALGAQFGCDRQTANWVWGAKVSLGKTDMTGSHHYEPFGSGPSNRVTYDVKWLATLTGRLGYLLTPATLAYLQAGAAWARTDYDDSDHVPVNGVPYTGNTTVTRHGWLAGLGLEQRLAGNLSAYVEYSYLDFGKKTVTIDYSDGATFSYPFKQRMNTLELGLNYRF